MSKINLIKNKLESIKYFKEIINQIENDKISLLSFTYNREVIDVTNVIDVYRKFKPSYNFDIVFNFTYLKDNNKNINEDIKCTCDKSVILCQIHGIRK